MIKLTISVVLLLIFLGIFTPLLKAQTQIENKDSLRTEIKKVLDRVERLQRNCTSKQIDSVQIILDSLVTLTKENLGYNDSLHVLCLYVSSKNCCYSGDWIKTETLALEMYDIVESVYSNNFKLKVNAYAFLGDFYSELGNYARAKEIIKKLLDLFDIYKNKLTRIEQAWHISTIIDMAQVEAAQGGIEGKALETLRYGLKLAEEKLGRDSDRYASIMTLIGGLLMKMERYDEAEMYIREAIDLIKKAYKPDNYIFAWASTFFIDYFKYTGNIHAADSILQLQLAIVDNNLGDQHPYIDELENRQIEILTIQDSLDRAIEVAQNLIHRCRSRSEFPSHRLMNGLKLLGIAATVDKRSDLLEEIINELSSSRQSYIMNVFRYSSENQKLSFVKEYPPIEPLLLSGVLQGCNPTAITAAVEMILNGKGLAIDLMAAEQSTLICAHDPILDSLLNKHKRIAGRIAGLAMSPGGGKDEMLEYLYSTKNQIEKELSLACSNLDLSSNQKRVTVTDVISALPSKSVLLEFIKYEYYDYDKAFRYFGHDSFYVAIVLTHDNQIEIMDLGDAPSIDNLVHQYQTVMSEAYEEIMMGKDQHAMQKHINISSKLYDRIIVPLESAFKNTNQIFISPDGIMNLLPFETLTKNGQKYLIEDYQFVYLTSGRDLLKDKTDLSGNDVIVMANPDYMLDPSVSPELASESTPMFTYRGTTTAPECLRNMFAPLPKTQQEGGSVANIMRGTGKYNVHYLESEQARENTLKNLTQPPDVLHIATHGYFCQQTENAYLSNPLLRSGLILAGANRTIGEMNEGTYSREDGILTAMEVSGLNLIGTDLVVLSACQSGVGDIQSGEGVFGLRRAFQHAGAKSIIMSLFAVPDKSTMNLMERFYKNWQSDNNKAAALRKAALSIIQERRDHDGFAHPLFWGGFILAGDPN